MRPPCCVSTPTLTLTDNASVNMLLHQQIHMQQYNCGHSVQYAVKGKQVNSSQNFLFFYYNLCSCIHLLTVYLKTPMQLRLLSIKGQDND
jgi:hypothetical protein